MKLSAVLFLLLRVGVGGLFVWAGVSKVGDPFRFSQQILNYHLVDQPVAASMALYLPWLEIVCGLSLAVGLWRRGAVAVLSALIVIFTLALLSAWWRRLDLDCGCFAAGGMAGSLGWRVLQDLLILAALVTLAVRNRMLARLAPPAAPAS